MKTTLEEIRSFGPCTPGWKKLIKGLRPCFIDTEVTIKQIIEINGIEDAVWALRTQKYEDYCLFLADVAESVLPIFKEKYPSDERPELCIKAIRDFKKGEIDREQLNADAAAYAAADAADAAADAAAAACAYAASGFVATTACAAVDAAYAGAAADAAYAGAADAAAAARNVKWEEIKQLLLKYA